MMMYGFVELLDHSSSVRTFQLPARSSFRAVVQCPDRLSRRPVLSESPVIWANVRLPASGPFFHALSRPGRINGTR